ncbi:Do family serine endopeptidase [Parasaccharibacter sp. TMW 2.1888]|uniref:Do family serine endopeptidase n=1 Tax=Parasaccharibacter sp. TMW 2.1888 TaxID=2268025 RepID=UPI00206ED828|nr:Do family serine endopeptidase [Parasaccharibacter sp. TMW 2.1888]UPO79884.1 Do family serine endopeptidase [Parasaccharibacter sp. TMW 2.1888]
MKSPSRLSLACMAMLPVLGLASLPLPAVAQNAPIRPQMSGGQGIPDFVQIVKQVKPAVVSITAHIREGADDEEGGPSGGNGGPQGFSFPFPSFPFPFQMMPGMPSNRMVEARGSGFIISADGYIVTNNHVINGATKVSVKLDDGTTMPAKVIGHDGKTDIALLRVKADHLPYVELGNSDDVQPGQWVVAVGNPYGLGGTVTAGIISALGRDLHSGAYNDFIQVDAPINHGNSGGPLITLDGKVIGVNSMIMSPNGGGSIGIGFAIPSATVRSVVDQLRATGHVVRGFIGVETQDITPTMARALGLVSSEHPGAPSHGALVANLIKGGPADRAGLKSGDVVLSLDGHDVRSAHDLAVKVVSMAPGSKGTFTVLRDGKTVSLTVTVGNQARSGQEGAGTDGSTAEAPSGKLGLALGVLTPKIRQELGLDDSVQGCVVADVGQGSPADHAGIRPGDIIVAVGNQMTANPHAVVALVQKALRQHQPPLLRILRDGQQLFVAVSPDGSGDGDEDGEDSQ